MADEEDMTGHNSGLGPDDMEELRKVVHEVEALHLQKVSIEDQISDIYETVKDRKKDDRSVLEISGIKAAVKERAAYRKNPDKYNEKKDLTETYLAAIPPQGEFKLVPARVEDAEQAKLAPYRPEGGEGPAAEPPAAAEPPSLAEQAAEMDQGPAIQVPVDDDAPYDADTTDPDAYMPADYADALEAEARGEPLDDDSQGTDEPMAELGDDPVAPAPESPAAPGVEDVANAPPVNGVLYENGKGDEMFCALTDPNYSEVSQYVVASARFYPDTGVIERLEDAEPDTGGTRTVTIADLPPGGRLDGDTMYDKEGEVVGVLATSAGAAVNNGEDDDPLAIPAFLRRKAE